MKKLACLMAAVITFTFVSVTGQAAEKGDPALAAAAFLEEIKGWDGAFARSVGDALFPVSGGDALLEMAARPILAKLDYRMGNSKIEDNYASVDLSITAADVKDAVRDLVVEAAGLSAIRHFTGLPIDVEKYVADKLTGIFAEDNLLTISTDCTMYLIMGGDGQWKLDLSDPKNLGLLNAAAGGIIPQKDLEALITAYS